MNWRIGRVGLRITLVIGLGLVGLGLYTLQQLFAEERIEAKATIEEHQGVLTRYAGELLLEKLEGQVRQRFAQMERATNDPLVSSYALYRFRAGETLLPRRLSFRDSGSSGAIELFQRLRSSVESSPEVAQSVPWGDRLQLRNQLLDALQRGATREIEATFREILTTHATFVVPVEKGLPYLFAVLRLLIDLGDPNPRLVRGLVKDGIKAEQFRVEALQQTLFRRYQAFTKDEFQFFLDEVRNLEAVGKFTNTDFVQLLAEPLWPQTRPIPHGKDHELLEDGWYLRNIAAGVEAVWLDLEKAKEEITVLLREGTLIGMEDAVHLSDQTPGRLLSEMRVFIDSAKAKQGLQRIESLYRIKRLLLLCTGGLAGLLVGIVLWMHERHQRLVDLKSSFVAAVSHELRTPLASIQLMAETLQRRFEGDSRARDYPARMVRDTQGLNGLVENILSFARLDKQDIKLHRQWNSLEELVHGVFDDQGQDALVEVQWSLDCARGRQVFGDAELLRLLLVNLVRNACQHNERKPVVIRVFGTVCGPGVPNSTVDSSAMLSPWLGKVRIGRKGQTHRFLLQVTDNGVGIAGDEWRTVFADFHRAAPAATRGNGLGLAICRRVAQLHGGTIRVASSDGQGTCLALDIPQPPPE